MATPLLNDTMTQAKYLCGSADGLCTPTMLAPARRPQPHHLLHPRRRRRPVAAVDWSLDLDAARAGAYAGRGGTRGGRAAGRGCGRGGSGGGSISFLPAPAVTAMAAAVVGARRRTVPLLRPSLLCRARCCLSRANARNMFRREGADFRGRLRIVCRSYKDYVVHDVQCFLAGTVRNRRSGPEFEHG